MSDEVRGNEVQQAAVPETLLGLVSHFSPTHHEGSAVTWLIERMQALGYARAFADPAGNAVGMMGSGPRQIVLLGHIDTVPGEIPVEVRDGNLYGRGSVDAKGPLASFVDAVARLGPVPGWEIVVLGCVDEEGDSAGAHYAVDQYHPEFAIVGEPSQWDRVTLGYKGAVVTEISYRRAAGHSAGPDLSAGDTVFAAWQSVLNWSASFNAERPRVFDQVLPTLRKLSSGSDGFVEWAALLTGVRLPPGLSPEDWTARLRDLASPCQVEPAGRSISAYQGEKNTPLVRAFLSRIRASGGKPGFVLKTGTADINIVAPRWQCPALAYGPGDSALDHSPDEHLALEEYARAVDVVAGVLADLTRE